MHRDNVDNYLNCNDKMLSRGYERLDSVIGKTVPNTVNTVSIAAVTH
jgi:hypothetical protein